jgi:hypothetical protein
MEKNENLENQFFAKLAIIKLFGSITSNYFKHATHLPHNQSTSEQFKNPVHQIITSKLLK